MNHIPELASDLISLLDEQFPHRCPRPQDNERAIWMYAGQRDLVDTLIAVLKEQDEEGNILDR